MNFSQVSGTEIPGHLGIFDLDLPTVDERGLYLL